MCTRCYTAFQEANTRQMNALEQAAMRTERDMYHAVGLPLPDHLRPRTPVVVRQDVKDHSIKVTGGSVGVINNGAIQQANVSIGHVPDENVRVVLAALAQMIQAANEAPAQERTEALDLVGALADEAAKPPTERRLGVLKTTLSGLGQAVSGLAAVKDLWPVVEPVLRAFFGL